MSKVLVTGGAGFVGSHLVEDLIGRGFEVAVLDNMSTGSLNNLKHVMTKDADLRILEGDIINPEDVEDAINGSEYVFHLAAIRSVPKSIDDPVSVNRANITGTLNVLEACRGKGVKRVIYAGSSSAYGHGQGPVSPYAVSKLAGAMYCKVYSEVFDLDTVELRFFNLFGSRQVTSGEYAPVIPRFIDRAMRGSSLNIHGDGSQAKDFTHVDNVVHACILAMNADETKGESVDIGCGRSVKGIDIARKIWTACQPDAKEIPINFEPPRKGDVQRSCANLCDLVIDYAHTTDFDFGLAKTIEWYKSEEGLEWVKNQ